MKEIELPYQATGRLLLSDAWEQASGVIVALHGYAMTAEMMMSHVAPLVDVIGTPGIGDDHDAGLVASHGSSSYLISHASTPKPSEEMGVSMSRG